MKILRVQNVLLFVLLAVGCSTTVRSYPIKSDEDRSGGIPFFVPKPVLHVRQPIEVGRTESLYALIEIGGLERFLYSIDVGDYESSLERLDTLLKTDLETADRQLTVLVEKTNTTSNAGVKTDTRKWTLIPAPENLQTKSEPLYEPASAKEAYEVLLVPDKEYELRICPSWFASSKTSVTLADGWRLTTMNADTGDSAMVKGISELAAAFVGAQKEVKVAQLAKEQALELQRLKQQSAEPTEGTMQGVNKEKPKKFARIVGYLKHVKLRVIEVGLYDLRPLIEDAGNKASKLPTETSTYWVQIGL